MHSSIFPLLVLLTFWWSAVLIVCVLLCECLPVLDMCYALFIDDCGVFVCLGMNSVLCVLGGYFWCFGDY